MKWEMKKLGELAIITYGYTEKASQERIGPKFLRITDIQNNNVNWENVPYCKIAENDLTKFLLKDNDIVFARTGATTGKSYLIKQPPESVYASYLIRVQIKDSNYLLPEFLYLYFQTDFYWNYIKSGISGSTQGGVNATKLGNLTVPIPPLQEQKRIVAILDEAFEAIDKAKENAKQNLENAKELYNSYRYTVFSNNRWAKKRLGEVCELISGQHINARDYNTDNKGVGYLTGPSDFGNLNPVISKWTEHPKAIAHNGDILITVKGSGIGKINLLDSDEVAISRQIMAIRVNEAEVATHFLYEVLDLNYELFQSLGNGAAIPGLSRQDVLNLEIALPTFEEQNFIVNKLLMLSNETKKLEEIYQMKLTNLEELKKSILQKAFNGEL